MMAKNTGSKIVKVAKAGKAEVKKDIKKAQSAQKQQKPNIKKTVYNDIASYYGFIEHPSLEITKADLALAKTLQEGDYIDPESNGGNTHLPLHVEEKISLLRMYVEKALHENSQPSALIFTGNYKNVIKKNDKFNRFCDLEIIGSNKSISEATLIQTAAVILKEAGYTDILVEINSIGDKDSINLFTKDLISYYRKYVNSMCSDCRQILKRDPFELVSHNCEKCKDINCRAPKSMAYLSDKSRNHLREILEYLEYLGIKYSINERLLGNRKYCTETIYEILGKEANGKKITTLAVGVRYDGLAKKIGIKKEIFGAGVSLLINPKPDNHILKEKRSSGRPLVYLTQLGFEAKLLSLKIIEILRQEKIPVYQALARDRISSQMNIAEKIRIPFTIIIGKKEAVDGTVIVRRMDNHSQEIIPVTELTDYLDKVVKTHLDK